MKNRKNIKIDDESMWPKEGLVELDPPHTDNRGAIQSIVNFHIANYIYYMRTNQKIKKKKL